MCTSIRVSLELSSLPALSGLHLARFLFPLPIAPESFTAPCNAAHAQGVPTPQRSSAGVTLWGVWRPAAANTHAEGRTDLSLSPRNAGAVLNTAAHLRHESTASTESGYQIKRYYSRAKLLLFPFVYDSADVPGNAKGLLFPTAEVPLHDGDGNQSPALPFAGARSAWSRPAPAAPRPEKAGAGWAYSVRATQGKENRTEQRRGRVAARAWSPITFHYFATWKPDTVKRSCALSDLQMQWLHGKPHEVFFSTEAAGFIDILSNIQA